MFVDTVKLQLSAGRGGDGVIAWRREKYIPKGGPVGGNGGHGGSVILEADRQTPSLEHLRNRRILKAKSGMPGGQNHSTGKNGENLHIKVPLGTLVKDPQTGEVLFDFVEEGQKWTICKGGKGGKGNAHFKTATHQAPYVFTEGTSGESIEIDLELKLIADIGLVGMPNAGKSTLISHLTYIQVKIAPYPFTTLRPNLGILQAPHNQRLLIADIPGIIDQASLNKGLGMTFLRHVERTSILLFVIEMAPYQERDPYEEFCMLRREIAAYNPKLLDKPFLTLLNKIDQEEAPAIAAQFRASYPFPENTLFEISALEKVGFEPLKAAIYELANRHIQQPPIPEEKETFCLEEFLEKIL